ncbi:TIGR02391 family protein [Aeromonas hydrophila]|uniref:TIGR02391 family protein n=1 Tax=Aeromonas hydrophila TaxID=644 RepID=UPI002238706A|nr:TIGR02391 family protein [Aeromonas hydrophila]MCW4616263.1 TIGR02391 family protein [Aeromonas hydrophila]HEB5078075.1 TIGR02391 family protein [Aeromonas hydrophila subsp. hydrophila]
MAAFPSFTPEHFESIARELGELVTGTQLDQLFDTRGITDISGQSTKWRRIQISLLARQEADRCGNNVAAFIMAVMAPGRHVNDQVRYETARGALNKVLIFDGLQLGENGQFRQVNAANTISEAKRRADGIASRLRGRDIHPEILRYCREELMQENYFHAVFEAAKSLAQRLRDMTGLPLDGAALIDKCFAESQPLIWINTLRTETERSEHKGFALLLKGAFAAIRNPTAHEPKILWQGEDDAADYFTLLSMLHRKLDSARAIGAS